VTGAVPRQRASSVFYDVVSAVEMAARGQPDENRVINFYRRSVLPEFARAASSDVH
jgi:hypothetical protein